MCANPSFESIAILVVEDNPADVRLIEEALREGKFKNRLNVVSDGVEALAYLRRQDRYREARRPDLVLLDLNLPKKDGREVLAEIKSDEELKSIPVVILTTSKAQEDILRTYHLNANCFITKPVGIDEFIKVVQEIEEFWLNIVKLPPDPSGKG
jgi:CheY-like chemotaxis protein